MLLADLLARGVRVRIRVSGSSMGRALRSGDMVTLEPLAGRARRGDLVMFRSDSGALVLHRVLRTWRHAACGWRYQTCGDASLRLDAVIGEDRILGRVTRVERGGAKILELSTRRARWGARCIATARLAACAPGYKLARLARSLKGLSGPANRRCLKTDR